VKWYINACSYKAALRTLLSKSRYLSFYSHFFLSIESEDVRPSAAAVSDFACWERSALAQYHCITPVFTKVDWSGERLTCVGKSSGFLNTFSYNTETDRFKIIDLLSWIKKKIWRSKLWSMRSFFRPRSKPSLNQTMFVCLLIRVPQGRGCIFRIIIVAILQVSIIPSTRPHASASLSQNPTRGPIKATRHHCLPTTPGPWSKISSQPARHLVRSKFDTWG
jgi:hypothetical protein